MKRPNTCTNLIRAIKTVAAGEDEVRLSRALANVIVGQMLPDGVVKGGSSLMFRYGAALTRYTRDVDTARVMAHDEYISKLRTALSEGWNDFTADLVEVEPPEPKGVPGVYVMKPYDAKVKYLGRPWQTVRIEIGHNEIGDADEYEEFLPEELAAAFEQLQFPRPRPLHVMKLSYQVAQKLHAVSEPGSERAHDLIDLQLIMLHSKPDLGDICSKCVRLFDYRRKQPWPPKVEKGEGWDKIYEAALGTIADKTALCPTVDDAVTWVNELVVQISATGLNNQYRRC